MKYILPRIQDILFITLLFSASLQGVYMLNTDGDTGRHITIGNYIINNGNIPTKDIFSHTMTREPLIPHEWLAQVIFGGTYELAGLGGVVLLVSFIIALTFTTTYRDMLKRDISHLTAFLIVILAAFASNLHWLARPHIFTFLFAAIWTYQLGNKSSKWWLFPLIMLIWVNTHGAFITGFAIWLAFFAGWLWDSLLKQGKRSEGRKLAIIGLSSLAVTLINPVGWLIWVTSVGYFGNHLLIDRTIEYQSPNFHISSTWPFLFMLILFLLANGVQGKLRVHEKFLLTGWGVLSLYNARNIPIFAIVVAPFLGQLIHENIKDVQFVSRIEHNFVIVEKNLRGLVFNLILIVLAILTTLQNPANDFSRYAFPVDAVNWLSDNPQEGKMYNFFTWGGYLLYRLWPEQQVFIDGQTDFYGEALTSEYLQVESLQAGWEDVLSRYDVKWAIIPTGQPLASALLANGWTIVYQDETAIILDAP